VTLSVQALSAAAMARLAEDVEQQRRGTESAAAGGPDAESTDAGSDSDSDPGPAGDDPATPLLSGPADSRFAAAVSAYRAATEPAASASALADLGAATDPSRVRFFA